MPDEAKRVGRKKRTWVRLDCQGVLHGSINFLYTLEEQAVFLKMIAMGAVYGCTPGTISDNEGKALPHDYIAHELHCPLAIFESVLKKGTLDHALSENSHGIELVNFTRYQFTEYDRQKPYREARRAALEADPEKFVKGKYAHLIARSAEDLRRIKGEEGAAIDTQNR
jgi:hypothetical protein